jgi:hypothetical protein
VDRTVEGDFGRGWGPPWTVVSGEEDDKKEVKKERTK